VCKPGFYWVKYKDRQLKVELKRYGTTLGLPDYNMFIGHIFCGRHWCVHCSGIYKGNHAQCIGIDNYKITRTINALHFGASKLRKSSLLTVLTNIFGSKNVK